MILYRCLDNNEIINMINNKEIGSYSVKGENTFKYKDNSSYKHFFVFSEHAAFFKKMHDYLLIGQYNIPIKYINQYGFGYYYGVETKRNNKLFDYFIPLPEVIIKEKDFDKDFLCDVQKDLTTDYQLKRIPCENKFLYEKDLEVFFDYKGQGSRGLPTDPNYSYSEIYYELVYYLIKKYNIKDIHEVVEYLDCKNIRKMIEHFFIENHEYFKKQTKEYIKTKNSYYLDSLSRP